MKIRISIYFRPSKSESALMDEAIAQHLGRTDVYLVLRLSYQMHHSSNNTKSYENDMKVCEEKTKRAPVMTEIE